MHIDLMSKALSTRLAWNGAEIKLSTYILNNKYN